MFKNDSHSDDSQPGKIYDIRLAKWLLSYLKPYKKHIFFSIFLLLIVSIIDISLPYLTKNAIDKYIIPQSPLGMEERVKGTVLIGALYILLISFTLVVKFLQTYILNLTGQSAMHDVRVSIFSHLHKLPISFFDKNPVGKLTTRVTNDVNAINEMLSSVSVYIIWDIFLILGTIFVMIKINSSLAFLILLLLPVLILITFIFRKRTREAYREVRTKIAAINTFLQESISGMNNIQIFNAERKSREKFKDINHLLYLANIKQIITFAVFWPIVKFIGAFAFALLVWQGGKGVISGVLTIGSLTAFISYAEMLFHPIEDLSEKYNIFQSAMAASERIQELLSYEGEKSGDIRLNELDELKIEFKDVWFSYDDKDWVLKGVSFTVNKGEKIAFVGETGVGKSSIINLLLGFYSFQKGQILINGKNIEDISKEDLRRLYAFVPQDLFLFSGDVKSNITLQNGEMHKEKVDEIFKEIGLDNFIKEPDFLIKERGAGLSEGEKQLLTFARALMINPPVVILDEATSRIDSGTELIIRKALKRLLNGRTSIIIAHRLSTIRDASKIFVLHKGRIVEEGGHDELLIKGGFYSTLYKLQFEV